MVHILFGVSGCGKTTIGKMLSKILQKPFFDADNYHTFENVLKMKKMLALTDEDRKPWLISLNKLIAKWNQEDGAILACSALKEKYRSMLAEGNNVSFIFLEGNQKLISKRLATRKGHLFPIELLQNQYDILEIPTYGIRVEVDQSPEDVCKEIYTEIKTENAKYK
jgi:carbohydrate kinase (thermoresistant glucokinase family)